MKKWPPPALNPQSDLRMEFSRVLILADCVFFLVDLRKKIFPYAVLLISGRHPAGHPAGHLAGREEDYPGHRGVTLVTGRFFHNTMV